jgi:hypothetical protein
MTTWIWLKNNAKRPLVKTPTGAAPARDDSSQGITMHKATLDREPPSTTGYIEFKRNEWKEQGLDLVLVHSIHEKARFREPMQRWTRQRSFCLHQRSCQQSMEEHVRRRSGTMASNCGRKKPKHDRGGAQHVCQGKTAGCRDYSGSYIAKYQYYAYDAILNYQAEY